MKRLLRFEKRRHKLASAQVFSERLLRHGLVAFATIIAALAIGMAGYMGFEGMGFIDAFVNSAMILSGMGPMGVLQHDSAKIFAGIYAIVCGLLIFAVAGLMLVPVFHRLLHNFHVDDDDKKIKIAAAQYPLDELKDLAAYEAKITRWVEEAVGAGAGLLVFPEYGSMELAGIGGNASDVQASFDVVSGLVPELDRVHSKLAAKHGVTIVAGSGPQRRPGCTMNVAHIFGPTGIRGHYDKIMPTPWERDPWRIASGKTLTAFDVGITRIGLLICYDIEFPLLSRALAEAGAEIILAPSNTETEWGYWRVRTGAMARALENQAYTVHSPVVGASPWSAACPANCGMAGIFAPSDVGFPPGGVLALGEMNKPQWVYAVEVDLDLISKVRASGGVQTYKHWPEQPGAGVLPKAQVVDISGGNATTR